MASAVKVQGTFLIFGFFAGLGALFIHSYMRETKGLSSYEMKNLYKEELKPGDFWYKYEEKED